MSRRHPTRARLCAVCMASWCATVAGWASFGRGWTHPRASPTSAPPSSVRRRITVAYSPRPGDSPRGRSFERWLEVETWQQPGLKDVRPALGSIATACRQISTLDLPLLRVCVCAFVCGCAFRFWRVVHASVWHTCVHTRIKDKTKI